MATVHLHLCRPSGGLRPTSTAKRIANAANVSQLRATDWISNLQSQPERSHASSFSGHVTDFHTSPEGGESVRARVRSYVHLHEGRYRAAHAGRGTLAESADHRRDLRISHTGRAVKLAQPAAPTRGPEPQAETFRLVGSGRPVARAEDMVREHPRRVDALFEQDARAP